MEGAIDQMNEDYAELRRHLGQVRHVQKAAAILAWDQETHMPSGGAAARAEQLTTLARLAHESFTSNRTGELLEAARRAVEDLPYDGDEASFVRVARRDWEKARKLPVSLIAESTRHEALAHEIWVRARADNDFQAFVPCLEKTLELARQEAECLGYEDHPYDALLDQYEPGMKTEQVRGIFEELKAGLVPLVHAIAAHSDRVDDAVLHQPFDEAAQETFGIMIAQSLGYDFSRGRQIGRAHV